MNFFLKYWNIMCLHMLIKKNMEQNIFVFIYPRETISFS